MKLFCLQLWGEVVKMSARPRTYIGFAAFILTEIVLAMLFERKEFYIWWQKSTQADVFDLSPYWSMTTQAYFIVSLTIFVLGGNFLALVLGDIVAKETEEGSFRLLMSRPVSRFRLLALKYLAGVIYTSALVPFIAITSLIVGYFSRGWGKGLFVWIDHLSFVEFYDSFGEALGRYALAMPFLILSTLTVSSIAFMLSCYRLKPAAATILTVSIMIVDMILANLPYTQSYREVALLTHMASYAHVFAREINWSMLLHDYAFLIGLDLSCFIIGWWGFQVRDFKS
jgi:ABC-2 type transport system permease protein